MNNETKEKLKKSGILSGIFLAAVLILWGTSHLGYILKEEIYIKSAETVFAHSPLCTEIKNAKLLKTSSKKITAPNFFNAIFNAEHNGSSISVIFVNMTGKYGTYQGMFVCKEYNAKDKQENSVKFCGLAGNIDLNKQPDYYGITPLIINSMRQKIEKQWITQRGFTK
ncbi:hypothetical protein [Treponema pedis]|uniref:Uncharacterized protein n=1 Tax=Treponema pedis TaxID=409322 RepID=A0A7S7AVU1_9SPIR|nr:hypothetical protein [Treponema pedis]QOW60202.1 hypothetical protein IFE08_10215 [Treponema pedis]QSI05547.1 hypothetical protein DYQ05_11820 [Treponema pedis]